MSNVDLEQRVESLFGEQVEFLIQLVAANPPAGMKNKPKRS